MTAAALATRPGLGQVGVLRLLYAVGYGLLGLFIFFICFTFLRPSPYDFTALPTILLWLCLGIRLHRGAVPFVLLLLTYHLALLLALLPYLDEPAPVEWTYQSAYLMVTAVFFVMLFSDDTRRRVEFALKAYAASAFFAALAGIASYFDLFGQGVLFKMDGRAAGVFEDPNVLGSFLIPAAVYLAHTLLAGRARSGLLTAAGLLLVLAGIFLSFSRGAWGATVVATILMVALTVRASGSARLKRRVVVVATLAALATGVGIAGLLSVESIAERFQDRAQVTKDYDEGETGRFGNQRRGIAMLIERPAGFGPLRWRLTFGLEPHNSYIGAFANGGWFGGFAFLILVLATGFVGFRLCLRPSPYRPLALVAWPALFVLFLQGLQIDIEKWRHVFLLLSIVWALEAARLKGEADGPDTASPEPGRP